MNIFLGGTFDPIHNGHIELADALVREFSSARVFLMPCRVPVHKQMASASVSQRLAMLELALHDRPAIKIDQRELCRSQASYTYDSLVSIRHDFNNESCAFVLGTDALMTFPSWYQATRMAPLTHLIVVERAVSSFTQMMPFEHQLTALDSMSTSMRAHLDAVLRLGFSEVSNSQELFRQSAGCLVVLKLQLPEVSSTQIRTSVKNGKDIKHLVCDKVADYIKESKLYLN